MREVSLSFPSLVCNITYLHFARHVCSLAVSASRASIPNLATTSILNLEIPASGEQRGDVGYVQACYSCLSGQDRWLEHRAQRELPAYQGSNCICNAWQRITITTKTVFEANGQGIASRQAGAHYIYDRLATMCKQSSADEYLAVDNITCKHE